MELDIIREVVFLTLGHSSILFHRNSDDKIAYTPRHYYSQHLSSGAIESIMKKFINLAEKVALVDRFVEECLSKTATLWTLAAFASAVEKEVLSFKNEILGLEKIFASKKFESKDIDPLSTSLLWLHGRYTKLFEPIQQILNCLLESNILNYSRNESAQPSMLVEKLLDYLYYKIAVSQELDQSQMLNLYFKLFRATIQPVMMWMSEFFAGSVVNDPHCEFFLIKQDDLKEILRPHGCPKFLKQFLPLFLSAYQSCSLAHFSVYAHSLALTFCFL